MSLRVQVRFPGVYEKREAARIGKEIWTRRPREARRNGGKEEKRDLGGRVRPAGEEKEDGGPNPCSKYGKEWDGANVRSRTEAKQEGRLRLQSLHGRVNMCNLDTSSRCWREEEVLPFYQRMTRWEPRRAGREAAREERMRSSVGCGQSGRENWQCMP